jgi:hypothetical protein
LSEPFPVIIHFKISRAIDSNKAEARTILISSCLMTDYYGDCHRTQHGAMQRMVLSDLIAGGKKAGQEDAGWSCHGG